MTDDDVRGAVWSVPRVSAPVADPRPAIRNVVLISLDTLRADHVSGYGYPRATSPAIDARLIAGGTTFADASTTFPRTDVSHLSLFTSLFPEAQPAPGRVRAGATATMLTESLRDAGLRHRRVHRGRADRRRVRLLVRLRPLRRARLSPSTSAARRPSPTASRFVRANARAALLPVPAHLQDAQALRDSGARYAALFATRERLGVGCPSTTRIPPAQRPQVDAYDRTVREADDLVASLLAELDRLGIAERTLVVLLSDHGEAFGEHGRSSTATPDTRSSCASRWCSAAPGVPAGELVAAPASIVDVAPTVLELLGLAPLPSAMGIDLTRAFSGAALDPDRPLFFSWMGGDERLGMRLGSVKLIHADGRYALFDLAEDPDEARPRKPTAEDLTALATRLVAHRAAAATVRANALPPEGSEHPAPIPERVEDSLRALGYL